MTGDDEHDISNTDIVRHYIKAIDKSSLAESADGAISLTKVVSKFYTYSFIFLQLHGVPVESIIVLFEYHCIAKTQSK